MSPRNQHARPLRGRKTREGSKSRPQYRPSLESLEVRAVLSTITWNGQGDNTSWALGTNWVGNAVPGPADEAVINVANNVTIQLPAAGISVKDLSQTGGTLTMPSGTMDVPGGLILRNGVFNDNGGTISGGVLIDASTLNLSPSAGAALFNFAAASTLNGSIAASQTARVSGGIDTQVATLTLSPGAANYGTLVIQPSNSMSPSQSNLQVAGGSTFVNYGSLQITPSSSPSILTGNITNQGTITIAGAAVTLAGSGTQLLNQGNGVINASGTLDDSATSFVNNGTLNIMPRAAASLTIRGTYVQGSTGALGVELGGTTAGTAYDQLNVTGRATLAGSLNVSEINGFQPTAGNFFTVLNYGSASGSFAFYNGTGLSGGMGLKPTQGPTDLTLSVAPAPTVTLTLSTSSLTVSASSSTLKQPVTLSASASTSSGSAAATGTVSFLDGSTVLGTVQINAGTASLVVTTLGLGTHSISASYSGDSTYAPTRGGPTSLYVGDGQKGDFDGDGKADLAVFGLDPVTKLYDFRIRTSSSNFKNTITFDNNKFGYGNAQSIPVTGDYFGEGRSAYALWYPNGQGGMNFVAISSVTGNSVSATNFGGSRDIPVVADIDGDGKADFGVYGYDPTLGYRFAFLTSSQGFSTQHPTVFNNNNRVYGYGNAQAIPVVADFDGSGKAGYGVYIPSASGSNFYYSSPTSGANLHIAIGGANDVPAAVEYDGDGKADLSLFGPDPKQAGHYRYTVLTSSSNYDTTKPVFFDNGGFGYGNASTVPVIADYEGNGKSDFAVFLGNSTGGMQYIYQASQTGGGVAVDFATATDIPLTEPTYLIARKVRG